MKLFGKEKDECGVRFYFLGIKVYEERKLPHARKTYVFGIRVKKKTYAKKAEISPATLSMQQKIEWNTRRAGAELKILTLGLFYKDLPKEQRYVLCFDALMSPITEAIDSWSFFQYLQRNNIPSKYVIHSQNSLFKELKAKNALKDIIPVGGEMQLLTDYPEIIAQSRLILCSFGFDLSRIFKQLPFAEYVFIEHGVTLLKSWTANYYSDNDFDAKLVPTRPTKKMYEDLNAWSNRMLCAGMPRWDSLSSSRTTDGVRKIFVFFTYRVTFWKDPKLKKEYLERIARFVEAVNKYIKTIKNVELYLSLHHTLLHQNAGLNFKVSSDIHIVPMSGISSIIKSADMLITDFSSVAFDMMYRDVPTIFYCFDADLVYSDKRDSISDYAKIIQAELYNCCLDFDSAISKLKYYVNNDFELEADYKEINNKIFWQRGRNCELLWKLLNK